ncbi:MAG: hypothetical protein WAL38_33140, partial [Solirubrobacteraceae bacterium]
MASVPGCAFAGRVGAAPFSEKTFEPARQWFGRILEYTATRSSVARVSLLTKCQVRDTQKSGLSLLFRRERLDSGRPNQLAGGYVVKRSGFAAAATLAATLAFGVSGALAASLPGSPLTNVAAHDGVSVPSS